MPARTKKQPSSAPGNGVSPSTTPTPTSEDVNDSLNASGSSTTSSAISGLLATAVSTSSSVDREEVKVNNASVTEMKHACDDALKRYLSRPELFKQIYTHTDIRLALGWASVFVAAGTGLYGWKVEFEKSKPVVWAGLILYITLTVLQTLYAYFIEGDTVFVGKRKTFDKRIMTERITISSTSTPSKPDSPPSYSLTVSYLRSSSGGKSLLGKGRTTLQRGFNSFFDERGVLDQEEFERWVAGIVGGVMDGKAD